MQLQVPLTVLFALSFWTHSAFAHDELTNNAYIVKDAALSTEIGALKLDAPALVIGARSEDFPSIVKGQGVVLLLTRDECYLFGPGEYRPSHCGDAREVAIALDSLPPIGQSIDINERDSRAFIATGSPYGGHPCIGKPVKIRVTREADFKGIPTFTIVGAFSLVSTDGEQKFCGKEAVAGIFSFSETFVAK